MIPKEKLAQRTEEIYRHIKLKSQNKRFKWNATTHEIIMATLSNMLPLKGPDGELLPIITLHKNSTFLNAIVNKVPTETSSKGTIVLTIKNLMHAGAFLDADGNILTLSTLVPSKINEDTKEVQNGLIGCAIRLAGSISGGLTVEDARPLALMIFGKGRPDFLELQKKIEEKLKISSET